jgi:hypothetical protein
MDKLQHFLDIALGNLPDQKPNQPPNDFTVQRQRAFEESAKKIEALRRARLAHADPEY